MTSLSHERGRIAEAAARHALEAAGYGVIESNYRVRGAELDHVARDDEGFVFVEVRARGPGDIEPSATLGRNKLRAFLRGARHWLARRGHAAAPWRLAVVSVDLDEAGRPVATTIIDDPCAHLPEYHDGQL